MVETKRRRTTLIPRTEVTRDLPRTRRTELLADTINDETLSIVLEFELAMNTMVTLAIFDERGRLVDILCEGWLQPGRHKVKWVGNSRPGRFKCLLDTPSVRLVKYVDVGTERTERSIDAS